MTNEVNSQTSSAIHAETDEGVSSDERQYVSFILANEEYGVPILKVQEIIRFTKLTRVPQSSAIY